MCPEPSSGCSALIFRAGPLRFLSLGPSFVCVGPVGRAPQSWGDPSVFFCGWKEVRAVGSYSGRLVQGPQDPLLLWPCSVGDPQRVWPMQAGGAPSPLHSLTAPCFLPSLHEFFHPPGLVGLWRQPPELSLVSALLAYQSLILPPGLTGREVEGSD